MKYQNVCTHLTWCMVLDWTICSSIVFFTLFFRPEKSEAKMICVHRLWMLVKPAILPVLRIIFISLVTFQYVKPRSWSTRKYAVHNLQICLAVLCLLTTAQIVIYLWPAFLTAKKRFTKKPYQKVLPYIMSLPQVIH